MLLLQSFVNSHTHRRFSLLLLLTIRARRRGNLTKASEKTPENSRRIDAEISLMIDLTRKVLEAADRLVFAVHDSAATSLAATPALSPHSTAEAASQPRHGIEPAPHDPRASPPPRTPATDRSPAATLRGASSPWSSGSESSPRAHRAPPPPPTTTTDPAEAGGAEPVDQRVYVTGVFDQFFRYK
jgi:hypothetical protein